MTSREEQFREAAEKQGKFPTDPFFPPVYPLTPSPPPSPTLSVALLPQLAGEVSNSVCIVIDALRATTVIATLFERGLPRLYVAGSHGVAEAFARKRGYLLCGETDGFVAPGFDFGNSPSEFVRMDFTDKPVVLSTSNGTKAVAAVSGAKQIYLGSALNRLAVSEAAWNEAGRTGANLLVVCSGTMGEFTLEDAAVAGGYVEALYGRAGAWELPQVKDSAIACRRLWQSEPNLLRGLMEGNHAHALAERGFGEDIGFCAAVDTLSHVPTLVTEDRAASVRCPVIFIEG